MNGEEIMQKNQIKTSIDVYGKTLNVKYTYLGSIFRQFVLSRTTVNYFHYLWRMFVILSAVAFVQFLLQKYFEEIPRIGVALFAIAWILASGVYCVMTEIVEESVEVIDGFGIQISSRGRFGKENKTFFDFKVIKDVIINEAVTMQRVLFYLALMVKTDGKEETSNHNLKENETRMVVLFKHTMPRLELLKDIYNEIEPFLNNHNRKTKNITPNQTM